MIFPKLTNNIEPNEQDLAGPQASILHHNALEQSMVLGNQ